MGKGRPASNVDNLIDICESIAQKMLEPQRLTTPWISTARYRDSFAFFNAFYEPGTGKGMSNFHLLTSIHSRKRVQNARSLLVRIGTERKI
jgi:hypothetical protein